MDIESARGRAVVVQPEEGLSYWQPVPANGFSAIKLTQENTGCDVLSSGFQTIAAGGRVRAHSHADQIELQICFRGKGTVVVADQEHPLCAGTTCFLGPGVRHEIINESGTELVMLWVIAPPGLDNFFAEIGRLRQPGEMTPEPFPRSSDIRSIEQESGFRDVE